MPGARTAFTLKVVQYSKCSLEIPGSQKLFQGICETKTMFIVIVRLI